MLKNDIANVPYVKAQHNRVVQAATGRSKGSIEFKFQNISAVLRRFGLPWVTGYVPMENFQRALLLTLEQVFSNPKNNVFEIFEPSPVQGLSDAKQLFIQAPPERSLNTPVTNKELERLVRKFDPAARDERNRKLGRNGEELVLNFERLRLWEERPDLAKKVRWVSEEDGDGAGFDILSFELTGAERLIEVKTTVGHQKTPFYISSNEYELSKERPDEFRLMRVFDFLKDPKAFELKPPLSEQLILAPQNYKASFQ